MSHASGTYKVIDRDAVIKYFHDIGFELNQSDRMILNNEFQLNELGDIFIDGKWMKTSMYNELWLSHSKLLKEEFVPLYVKRLRGETDGLYKNKQVVFDYKCNGDSLLFKSNVKRREKLYNKNIMKEQRCY